MNANDQVKRPDRVLVVARDAANPPGCKDLRQIKEFLGREDGRLVGVTNSSVDLYQLTDGRWSFVGAPREARPFVIDGGLTMLVPVAETVGDVERMTWEVWQRDSALDRFEKSAFAMETPEGPAKAKTETYRFTTDEVRFSKASLANIEAMLLKEAATMADIGAESPLAKALATRCPACDLALKIDLYRPPGSSLVSSVHAECPGCGISTRQGFVGGPQGVEATRKAIVDGLMVFHGNPNESRPAACSEEPKSYTVDFGGGPVSIGPSEHHVFLAAQINHVFDEILAKGSKPGPTDPSGLKVKEYPAGEIAKVFGMDIEAEATAEPATPEPPRPESWRDRPPLL